MGMPGKSVARLLLAAAAAAAAGLVAVDASYPVSSENSWVHLRGRKGTMLGRLVLNMPRVAPLALRGGGETVEFSVMCDKTAFGESVGILGSSEALGAWKTPVPMNGKQFPKWTAAISATDGENLEYKYCMIDGQGEVKSWETKGSGANRKVRVSGNPPTDQYGHPHGLPKPARVASFGNGLDPKPSGDVNWSVETAQLSKFGAALARANEANGSWRQKLEYVQKLFTDGKTADEAGFTPTNPKTEDLAIISIYLHFLRTGQVSCTEDGRHFRPNHLANCASAIDEALDKVAETPANAYVIRKIRPLLPSYSAEFTASVPMTRIRDIAHRNDIPRDLKLDIKHNLQNKLHRCAGPEDLVTAERIWAQVQHGDYSHGFKEALGIFMVELREFFNAAGLEDRLSELRGRGELDGPAVAAIDRFLDAKRGHDTFSKLDALVAMRREFQRLAAAAPHGEGRQRLRLTDHAVEQFAFVLLAELAQGAEAQAESGLDWGFAMAAAKWALEVGEVSGSVDVPEARALIAEARWMLADPARDLQVNKAWLDRAMRLCTAFSDAMQALFLAHVGAIGRALHVDDHAAAVFVEAEVRASVVFQLSRIIAAATKAAKRALNSPPWTALQPGTAQGKLVAFPSLAALIDAPPQVAAGERLIALLDHAEGDEDIPPTVAGIVLGDELPLLSHLGVRARQQGVVFACSDGAAPYAEAKGAAAALLGQTVSLDVKTSGQVQLAKAESRTGEKVSVKAREAQAALDIGSIDTSAVKVLECSAAKEKTCGAKAAAAGEIAAITNKNNDFKAPPGCALPFGIQVAAAASSKAEYMKLADAFDAAATDGQEAETRASEIRSLIAAQWKVPPGVVAEVQRVFAKGARVMVRSSANCEDLQAISGAGLYDSISNVCADSAEALSVAINRVWQSLWTKRAALSRRAAKMKHSAAAMGVLVQEMVPADLSFIAFSCNPLTRDTAQVYVEMCVGMGETLASAAQPGTPYRFTFDKASDEVSVSALASFSNALVPAASDATGAELDAKPIDYSTVAVHGDGHARAKIVKRIAAAAIALEKARGSPQDVEGVVVQGAGGEHTVHIVQARPMVLASK